MTDKDQTNRSNQTRPRKSEEQNVVRVTTTKTTPIFPPNQWAEDDTLPLIGKPNPPTSIVSKANEAVDTTTSSKGSRLTYGDQMKIMMNDGSIRNMIYNAIKSGHLPIVAPILRLEIECQYKDYDLDKEDIREVFARYGDIVDVILKPNLRAYIVFRDVVSTVFAKKCMNGYYLTELDIRLHVSWLEFPEGHGSSSNDYNELIDYYEMIVSRGTIGGGSYPNVSMGNTSNNLNTMDNGQYNAMAMNNKLTCRYEIQIENDKEFQVARKIIGAKGSNMKRIIECCHQGLKNADPRNNQAADLVKLRLRGRGSGFKEGPDRQESQDPLHLCISAKSKDIYDSACQQVELLISAIYEDYRKFCQSRGRPLKNAPTIKKIETFHWTKQPQLNYPEMNDMQYMASNGQPHEYPTYQGQPQGGAKNVKIY